MRKYIGILFTLTVFVLLCMPALASDTETADGFYDIGASQNVVITPLADNTEVAVTEENIDGKDGMEKWYINSNRLRVTYNTAVAGGYYGVMLVEGSELPTKDTVIYYSDQVTATSQTVNFDIYSYLPDKTTEMSLYITGNTQEHELVKIPLNYAKGVKVIPKYDTGDIDGNGKINASDSLLALLVAAGFYDNVSEAGLAVADVNSDGKINSVDALMILQFSTGAINTWD